jgi:hypothetical protein
MVSSKARNETKNETVSRRDFVSITTAMSSVEPTAFKLPIWTHQSLRMQNGSVSIPSREERIQMYETSPAIRDHRSTVEARMERSFTKKAYQRAHYIRQKWDPRPEGRGEISLTQDLLRTIKKCGVTYRLEASRAVISEKDFTIIRHLADPDFDHLRFTMILRLPEWIEFVARHHLASTGEDSGCVPPLPNQALRELGETIGMPVAAFKLSVGGGGDLNGRIDRPVLYRAYSDVLRLHPYDLDAQADTVRNINEAYDYAIANLADTTNLKVDYDLVVLRNYQTLSRIQTSPDLPLGRVPRYWFDPADLAEGAPRPDRSGTGIEFDVTGTMGVLAIEESWTQATTRYLVEAGFPAGSMFLRTKVEAQTTTTGGGIEYIYLPGHTGVTVTSATRL